MIYIFAPSKTVAEDFILEAHLFGEKLKIIAYTPDHVFFSDSIVFERFEEGDEVFVLENTPEVVVREARVAYDKAFPKPHLYRTNFKIREVERVSA